MPNKTLFVIAILLTPGCGMAVRPDGGADAQWADGGSVDADAAQDASPLADVHSISDGDADASELPLGPTTAIVNVTNTLPRAVLRDNIEAMHFLTPFAPVRGAWIEVSGRCLVDHDRPSSVRLVRESGAVSS